MGTNKSVQSDACYAGAADFNRKLAMWLAE